MLGVRPGPALDGRKRDPREPRYLQGRAEGEPLEELDDPAEVRAARAARRDPLASPDEPLPLRLRPYDDAPAGRPPAEVRIIVRRELGTVGDAKEALAAALPGAGVPPAELRLVLGGLALRPDDALLWDAGCRADRLLYWQRVPPPA